MFGSKEIKLYAKQYIQIVKIPQRLFLHQFQRWYLLLHPLTAVKVVLLAAGGSCW